MDNNAQTIFYEYKKYGALQGYREVILSLDKTSKDHLLRNLREIFSRDWGPESTPKNYPRVLDSTNMLIPDITLMQNLRFFLELKKIQLSQINSDINIIDTFKSQIYFKRGEVDESEWQSFALILYILISESSYFISMPIGVALSGRIKDKILYAINELRKSSPIFFYANPPAIDSYKGLSENFRILENNKISSLLSYDEARECIIQHNNKINNATN